MKKRTLIAATLLAATVSHASKEDSAKYIAENTGANQERINTLCLKVDTHSIYSMGPKGGVSSIIGLRVAEAAPADVLTVPNYETGLCDEGFVKITTTANLISIKHAPVGL